MDNLKVFTSILSDIQEKLGHEYFSAEPVSAEIKAFEIYCKGRRRMSVFMQTEECLHSFIFSDDFKTLIQHNAVPLIQKKEKNY